MTVLSSNNPHPHPTHVAILTPCLHLGSREMGNQQCNPKLEARICILNLSGWRVGTGIPDHFSLALNPHKSLTRPLHQTWGIMKWTDPSGSLEECVCVWPIGSFLLSEPASRPHSKALHFLNNMPLSAAELFAQLGKQLWLLSGKLFLQTAFWATAVLFLHREQLMM